MDKNILKSDFKNMKDIKIKVERCVFGGKSLQ